MTRTKPAEQRRADLLAAGKELFLAKGVAATSLEDITSRAGVSKGLFYLYFRSKDELLAALQDQFSIKLADRIRATTEPVEDWPAKLDACVRAIFESYQESYDLHEVLFQHGGHVSASHRSAHALTLRAISDLLAGGEAADVFDVEDPEATAVLCWASTHGFDPDFHGQPSPADARLIRAAQCLFRRAAGITAEPPQLIARAPPDQDTVTRPGESLPDPRVRSQWGRSGPPAVRLVMSSPLRLAMRSPERGADTLVWLSCSAPGKDWQNGGYFASRKPAKANPAADDPDLALLEGRVT